MLLFCLLTATGALAAEGDFYRDAKRGWFWYESPPLEKSKTENEAKSLAQGRMTPSLDNYTVDELWNLHPDDFQNLLNDVQKSAVRIPTESNIMEYLTMQDIARRKALAYTNATMYVTQKYGDLFNVNQVYPAAAPGVSARVAMQQQEIEETVTRAGEDHGLLFFVSPGCGFCTKQSQILGYFKDRYDWQIKVIDISRDADAASRFNITNTPTLLLIKKGQDNYMTVATGVIAMTELERKLYRAIRYLQGDTRGDNFLMYDFQKGSAFDPTSILNKDKQPWKTRTN